MQRWIVFYIYHIYHIACQYAVDSESTRDWLCLAVPGSWVPGHVLLHTAMMPGHVLCAIMQLWR
jgi:hypothetical protein